MFSGGESYGALIYVRFCNGSDLFSNNDKYLKYDVLSLRCGSRVNFGSLIYALRHVELTTGR